METTPAFDRLVAQLAAARAAQATTDADAEFDDATPRACATCGHPEDGDPAYARPCCTDDNLI